MRAKNAVKAASLAMTLVLGLTACNSGSQRQQTGIISTDGVEPQNPLITTDTTETGGGRILNLLSEGLYTYDEQGNLKEAGIQSWQTNDNQYFTVKIKPGKTFDNGEPITANSYVDAWNYGASAKNEQKGSNWFQDIQGYSETDMNQDTLSGLKVVDDTTFTIALKEQVIDYQDRMGYTVFHPLPKQALEDPDKYGQSPASNGPYKLKAPEAWQHDTQIELVKNPTYDGTRQAQNDGVTFKFYQSTQAAYNDAKAGTLDVLHSMPLGETIAYETDFKDRYRNSDSAANTALGIPTYLNHFKEDQEGKLRRQAIAYAIDGDQLVKDMFGSTETSAGEFVPTTLPGYQSDIPGSENLNFDPAKAKALWTQADAISPYTDKETFSIAYNSDEPNKEWVEALAAQLSQNLGIKVVGKAYDDKKSFLKDRDAKRMTGGYSAFWQGDYPSIYNFLQPVYQTGATNNSSSYSNAAFDAKLHEAQTAPSIDVQYGKLNEAQGILLADLPAIPLFNSRDQAVWSERIKGVELSWNGQPEYYNIQVKDAGQ